MKRTCFDYQDGVNTNNMPVWKRQCFCGTTACQTMSLSKMEVCMCCREYDCDYSTVGCPWYIDRASAQRLLAMFQSEASKTSPSKESEE